MTGDGGRAPLRFATFLAPNMLPVYRFLADRVGRRLGRPVELVVAAPVLAGTRYGGIPVYYSDVIVRQDSPITGLEELRGRSRAYNEPASHSGHTVTLHSLVAMGARPGFLGPVLEAGFHQRAVRLVHDGTVDAAAIDSQVLAIELRDHPDLAGLRVVGSFGPSTIQPVVAASRLPARLKDQVRELLVTLDEDPAARPVPDYGLIDRFTRVEDGAYDDIRAVLATIEAAGWTSLTQTATAER